MFWHVSVYPYMILSVHGRGGQSTQPRGGGQSSRGGGGISPGGMVSPGGWGGVSPGGGSVQPGGVSPAGGGEVSQYRTTEWVLTTRWAVCLLRSRRRTFLWCKHWQSSLRMSTVEFSRNTQSWQCWDFLYYLNLKNMTDRKIHHIN